MKTLLCAIVLALAVPVAAQAQTMRLEYRLITAPTPEALERKVNEQGCNLMPEIKLLPKNTEKKDSKKVLGVWMECWIF